MKVNCVVLSISFRMAEIHIRICVTKVYSIIHKEVEGWGWRAAAQKVFN